MTDPTCKICSSSTKYYGSHDLSKGCNNATLPATGITIKYHKCDNCGLIFTTDMDDWSVSEFKEKIYNDQYVLVDPEYVDIRPKTNANWLHGLMKNSNESMLDYGGGNGKTAEYMKQYGYSVDVYDEFACPNRPEKTYDVISAIEVFEHTTKPYETLKDIISFLKIHGKIIFTTFTNDGLPFGEMHWYISPRNGHVTIHSKKSLRILLERYGMTLQHITDHSHIAKFNGEQLC